PVVPACDPARQSVPGRLRGRDRLGVVQAREARRRRRRSRQDQAGDRWRRAGRGGIAGRGWGWLTYSLDLVDLRSAPLECGFVAEADRLLRERIASAEKHAKGALGRPA